MPKNRSWGASSASSYKVYGCQGTAFLPLENRAILNENKIDVGADFLNDVLPLTALARSRVCS